LPEKILPINTGKKKLIEKRCGLDHWGGGPSKRNESNLVHIGGGGGGAEGRGQPPKLRTGGDDL